MNEPIVKYELNLSTPNERSDNSVFYPIYQDTLYHNEDAYFTFILNNPNAIFSIKVIDVTNDSHIGQIAFPAYFLIEHLNRSRDNEWISLMDCSDR